MPRLLAALLVVVACGAPSSAPLPPPSNQGGSPAAPPEPAPEVECIPIFDTCSCSYRCATDHTNADCDRVCPPEEVGLPPVCGWVGGACVTTQP